MYKLAMEISTESFLVYMETLSQRLLRTSELCALVKRVLAKAESLYTTRDLNSTELFQTSCSRAVISHLVMVVENLSTETNLTMKTSRSSTPDQDYFPWLTLE